MFAHRVLNLLWLLSHLILTTITWGTFYFCFSCLLLHSKHAKTKWIDWCTTYHSSVSCGPEIQAFTDSRACILKHSALQPLKEELPQLQRRRLDLRQIIWLHSAGGQAGLEDPWRLWSDMWGLRAPPCDLPATMWFSSQLIILFEFLYSTVACFSEHMLPGFLRLITGTGTE